MIMNTLARMLTALSVFFITSVSFANTDEFPNRALFPETTPISLEKLMASKGEVQIVDVRSAYEFDTLHIKDAVNIPLNSTSFIDDVRKLRQDNRKPIVFYCNGKTCKKSYKAARRAKKYKIDSVFVFDAGIFDWARAYPEESILLQEPLQNPDKLISTEYLKSHMLEHKAFIKKAGADKDAIILDIRDPVQRAGLLIFSHRENFVPLDNNKLQKYVDMARNEGRTLMIYDAVGKQVRWLQYYLEQQGVSDYYFMNGGAKSHFDSLIAKYKKSL
jgi:rhodanese-related sulfurtransferase